MGDRCDATVTVLARDAKQAEKVIEQNGCSEDVRHDKNFTEFYFEQVNYGRVPCLGALFEAGIPFDRWHSDGDEYREEHLTVRFDAQGQHELKQWLDHQEHTTDLGCLEKICNDLSLSDAEKYQSIKHRIDQHSESITPMSWSTQTQTPEEIQALRLITGVSTIPSELT